MIIKLGNTDGGTWGDWAFCSMGHFVNSVKTKTETFKDSPHRDSALNAVLLTCSDGETLTSKEGSQGKWSSEVNVTGLRGATMRDGSNARYGASAIKFEERIWYIKNGSGFWKGLMYNCTLGDIVIETL